MGKEGGNETLALYTVSTSLYIYLQVMKGKIIVQLLHLAGKGSDPKEPHGHIKTLCVYSLVP